MQRCLQLRVLYSAMLVTLAGFISCSGSADERGEAAHAPAYSHPVRDTISVGKDEIGLGLWKEAAALVRQLSPASFGEAPANVRKRLTEEGCSVPQAFYPSTPHNLISGEFAAPGQVDWAALCTQGDSAGIVLVWGGPSRCPSPIAWSKNEDYLQGIGEGRIGYSRAITAASIAFILERAKEYGGPPPPSSDHSGINDAFIEKASGVHFCSSGRWFSLQGSD